MAKKGLGKVIFKSIIVGFIGAIIVGKGILFLYGTTEASSEAANVIGFFVFISLIYAVIKNDTRKK